MEKSTTDIYKQLADKKGALIPSDQVLATAWGMTNGAATGARNRLRQEGYEFVQRDDGYWEVTQFPGDSPSVTHYHASEDGIYKIHHERVAELPKHVIFRSRGRLSKWEELQNLLVGMELDEVQRVHFTSYKIACQAQSALYGHCKREKLPYTIASTIDPPRKDANDYWLYFQKVAKDPAEWGHGANVGVKRQRRK